MDEKLFLQIVFEVSGKPVSQIKDESSLGLDLMMDSMARIELVSLIEEKTGVGVDETKIDARTTVADVRRMIEEK
jgi:acyl carrier protein